MTKEAAKLRRGDNPEAFPGEWLGREVRVSGSG